MNNIKTNLLFCVLMALIFLAYMTTLFVLPEDLFYWIAQKYDLQGERAVVLSVYINDTVWMRMRLFLILSLVTITGLFYWDRYFFRDTAKAMRVFFLGIREDLRALPWGEKLTLSFLSLFYMLALCMYSSVTPLQLDELNTWLFFIDRGPGVTMAYYPANNNHIAYNLLSIPGNYFLRPLWAVRLISMLSSLAVLLLLFLILKRRYNSIFSFAGIILLMSLSAFLWYSIQGRGYVLELLGIVALLYLLMNSATDSLTDKVWILCSAFTVYVIPVALIPVSGITLLYFYKLIKTDKNYYRCLSLTLSCALLLVFLYAPVWIFSDVRQLISNPFVQRIAYERAPVVSMMEYFPQIWRFITGTEGLVSLIFLGANVMLSVLMYLKRQRFFLIPLLLLLIPVLLLHVYPVLLFERTWLWLVIPFLFWVLEIAVFFFGVRTLFGYCFMLFVIPTLAYTNFSQLYLTHLQLRSSEKNLLSLHNYACEQLSGKVLKVEDDALYVYFRFYHRFCGGYTLLHAQESSFEGVDVVLYNTMHSPGNTKGSLLWKNDLGSFYSSK